MKEGCPTDEVVLIALGIEALLKLFLFCYFDFYDNCKRFL